MRAVEGERSPTGLKTPADPVNGPLKPLCWVSHKGAVRSSSHHRGKVTRADSEVEEPRRLTEWRLPQRTEATEEVFGTPWYRDALRRRTLQTGATGAVCRASRHPSIARAPVLPASAAADTAG